MPANSLIIRLNCQHFVFTSLFTNAVVLFAIYSLEVLFFVAFFFFFLTQANQ